MTGVQVRCGDGVGPDSTSLSAWLIQASESNDRPGDKLATCYVGHLFLKTSNFFDTPPKRSCSVVFLCWADGSNGQEAPSHLSRFFHLAWGSVVFTVWRLKHPLSFPAPVVAFPPKKRVERRYELYFSTPFRADYREPAFQWPPRFMVVSGKSHQRGENRRGADQLCVVFV